MEAWLNRLAKPTWVSWLTCIGLGAAAVAFDKAGYDRMALVFYTAIVAAMMIVVFDYVTWQARTRQSLGATMLGNLRLPRDWTLLGLMLASFLAMTAVYILALPHDFIMPLFASMVIPSVLKSRSTLITQLKSGPFVS